MNVEDCLAKTKGITIRPANHRASRIAVIDFLRDMNGRYIPFCDFHQHRGVVVTNYRICEERNCSHYFKLRPDGNA